MKLFQYTVTTMTVSLQNCLDVSLQTVCALTFIQPEPWENEYLQYEPTLLIPTSKKRK